MKILYIFISVKIYTGEDLKWDTPTGGVISNSYRYRSIAELKCPILILQWCKGGVEGMSEAEQSPPCVVFLYN